MTSRGGKRMGAGRPKGTNHYGEPANRCVFQQARLTVCFDLSVSEKIWFLTDEVPAGFPSADVMPGVLDLNTHHVRRPQPFSCEPVAIP